MLSILVLVLFLSGCADAAHTYQRHVLGIDCRQLQADGQCTPVRK